MGLSREDGVKWVLINGFYKGGLSRGDGVKWVSLIEYFELALP